MKELKIINIENVTDKEKSEFNIRNTVRAVIFDNDNNIALMDVSAKNFHKLPGGGIDGDETKKDALKRECLEEAGVDIDLIKDIGLISEIKKTSETIQNSYCYLAQVKGEKRDPDFTEEEIESGFKLKWITLDEAMNTVTSDGFSNVVGNYIFERELTILKEAKEIS
jgi:8-oxo-dGTP diphosphatase